MGRLLVAISLVFSTAVLVSYVEALSPAYGSGKSTPITGSKQVASPDTLRTVLIYRGHYGSIRAKPLWGIPTVPGPATVRPRMNVREF